MTLFLCLFALVLLGLLVWWAYHRPRLLVTKYETKSSAKNFKRATFNIVQEFNRKDLTLNGQSRQWREEMKKIGNEIRQACISKVYFTHGTFVGGDPWGILDATRILYPDLSRPIVSRINGVINRKTNALFRDTGNFTHEYVNLFGEAVGLQNCTYLFNWSSGNHHAARLKAAVELLLKIESDLTTSKVSKPKILLQGHSHAGQVFALLAHIMDQKRFGSQLTTILASSGYDKEKIDRAVSKLSDYSLDFVTLGAPVVYAWPKNKRFRILHLINHRGPTNLAGKLRNFLTTKDGDYIQQLGILGSDIGSASPHDRLINRELDRIIGRGQDLITWQNSIQHRMRVSPHGSTILIDYQDQSLLIPNFFKTLFGHGIYTKYEAMAFNSKIIVDHFYRR